MNDKNIHPEKSDRKKQSDVFNVKNRRKNKRIKYVFGHYKIRVFGFSSLEILPIFRPQDVV